MATIFEQAYTVGMRKFLQRFKKEQPIFSFFKDFVFGGSPIFSTTEEILTQYQVRGVDILDDTFRGGSAKEFAGVDGFTNKKYTPAYFFYGTNLNRADFQKCVFGEDPARPLSPKARLSAVAAQKAWYIRNSYKATIEKMCADVLFDGKITPKGNAAGDIVFLENGTEFPVTGNIKTESTLWTSATDIYARLTALTTEQFEKSGAYPTHLICGTTIMEMIQNDTKIQKLLDNRRMFVGEISIRPGQYAGVAEVGEIALPNGCILKLVTYVGFYKDGSGNNAAYMPTNKILLVSKGIGQMGYAALEGIDNDGNATLVPGEEYVSMSRNDDIPVVHSIKYQSAPLPMPQKLDGWLAVKVLA